MKTNDTIDVHLLRSNQELVVQFSLENFRTTNAPQEPAQKGSAQSSGKPSKEQLQVLQERHKFAPTLHDIREQERHNMLNRSRRNLTSKFAE